MLPAINICTTYSEQRGAKIALSFAASLLSNLKLAALHLYIPGEDDSGQGDKHKMQRERVLQVVLNRHAIDPSRIQLHGGDLRLLSTEQMPQNAILVQDDLRRDDVHTLAPFDEARFAGRSGGGLLVPFGEGHSGLSSATLALALAEELHMPVTFYHTTWPAAGCTSPDARQHMCSEALAVCQTLERMATSAGVSFHTHIEMANDVVEGILQCAVALPRPGRASLPADLIVMSAGTNIGIGSYVDKTMAFSSTPLLVVAGKGGVE